MIDSSEKRNRQLAFELQNSHVCEKRSNLEERLVHAFSKTTCFGPEDSLGISHDMPPCKVPFYYLHNFGSLTRRSEFLVRMVFIISKFEWECMGYENLIIGVVDCSQSPIFTVRSSNSSVHALHGHLRNFDKSKYSNMTPRI